MLVWGRVGGLGGSSWVGMCQARWWLCGPSWTVRQGRRLKGAQAGANKCSTEGLPLPSGYVDVDKRAEP